MGLHNLQFSPSWGQHGVIVVFTDASASDLECEKDLTEHTEEPPSKYLEACKRFYGGRLTNLGGKHWRKNVKIIFVVISNPNNGFDDGSGLFKNGIAKPNAESMKAYERLSEGRIFHATCKWAGPTPVGPVGDVRYGNRPTSCSGFNFDSKTFFDAVTRQVRNLTGIIVSTTFGLLSVLVFWVSVSSALVF